MALNFTTSYTFSAGTTISSSQVNTNFSDIGNVFTGLEAETKTLAKLKVDADPTIALEVATKQYVDHYSTWRRPVLQFGSIATVAVESGLDGTSGDIPILFPDGTVRTETSTTRTTFNITRNVVLTTSGAQSGLTGATSEASGTWYALYAAKVTDSSTLWCTVGSTVIPTQGNYATLNAAYGTSGWVYLGMIRNGDNSGVASDILNFIQVGNTTFFINSASPGSTTQAMSGTLLATTAGATSLTYTYAAGTGAAQIPAHLGIVNYGVSTQTAINNTFNIKDSGDSIFKYSQQAGATSAIVWHNWESASLGVKVNVGASIVMGIMLCGFCDGVLGVGSNPIL